jgi:CSLREA domain-containing protein
MDYTISSEVRIENAGRGRKMKIKRSSYTVVLLLFCSLLAGAIAVEAEATFTVDSTNDAVDAHPGDGICATAEGECTLRAAIQEANASEGEDTIHLPIETFNLTIPGMDEDASASGDLDITDNLSIIGGEEDPYEPMTTIQGGQLDRVIHVHPGTSVEINYVVISHGDVQDPIGGAGIYNQGDLSLYASKIIQNSTPGMGGGVRNEGSLSCDSCDILNNEALEGGGIYNSGVLNIYSSSINENIAIGNGGGIFNTEDAFFHLTWAGVSSNEVMGTADGGGIYNLGYMELGEIALVSFNKTNGSGGGIYNAGTMQVLDLDSSNNFAGIDGGSIYNTGIAEIRSSFIYENSASSGAGIHSEWHYQDNPTPPSVTLQNSIINDNHAALIGGGIFSYIGTFTIENATIEGNTANIAGGVATFSGYMEISGTTVAYNSATSQGGGFFNVGDIHLLSSIIHANTAQEGGGFYNNETSLITSNQTDLVGNSAQIGGGLYNLGYIGITDSSLQNNSVEYEGGGLYNLAGYAEFDRSSFYANSAQTGGAIYNASSELQAEEIGSLTDSMNKHISELFYSALATQRENAGQSALPDLPVPGVVTIMTSTIGVNSATDQGGAIYNLGEVQLNNDTFSDNLAEEGDSIFNGDALSRVVILNTILASSDVDDNCAGFQTIESGGYNLETGDSCGLHSEGDLIETDPLLMLINFPGIGLSSRSPAIDAGSNQACSDTDQRGVIRPIDGTGDGMAICDIGSYEAPEPDLIFADVPLNHWAYDYILSLYEDGYIAGCTTDPERRFCPQNTMNRAESSVFIVRGIHPDQPGYLPATPTTQYFNDVPIGSGEEWFSKWVGELYEQGFTSGCSENPPLYCPENHHSRAEATVFYLRLLNGPDFDPVESGDPIYHDVDPTEWYSRWVNAAHEAGLIQLCQTDMENMLFRPEEELTRAEAACMMYQAISKQVVGSVLIEDGICCVAGTAGETIDIDASFEATSPMWEVAEMRILSGSREFLPAEMESAPWEPFATQKTFSITVPLNWSGFYVYVQYRDSSGNLSPITSDDISVEGQPIEPPPTPTPIPTQD